ncbi:hypothetical protein N7G274_010029 [Stereocaulon virgatum]|uniref:Uncharacterized protein n=1 Tax=Stereocaulon virgatum TaxID=373712 RepID=A0ABR3ZW68_9LECA
MSQAPHGVPGVQQILPQWSEREEMALVYFISLGVSKEAASELISRKSGTRHVRARADIDRMLQDFEGRHPGLLANGRRLDEWLRGRLSDADYGNLLAVGLGDFAVIEDKHNKHEFDAIRTNIYSRERRRNEDAQERQREKDEQERQREKDDQERQPEDDEQERRRKAEQAESTQWWRLRNQLGELPQ